MAFRGAPPIPGLCAAPPAHTPVDAAIAARPITPMVRQLRFVALLFADL
jgi:hypothetical protein